MKQHGDVTKISGFDVAPVNVIIGGSPCQDLSIAGRRAGLAGARSGLFMEQLRIIKEMRLKDEQNGRTGRDIRPRFMVWENVPGAFSSNKGEDFRAVLEETARVVDKTAVIPRPPKGKWTTAGAVVADGWSLSWRVLDAQFWGVPQRRRRIALVADFGGESAPEILFERESVSGNIAESGTAREEIAADTESGIDTADTARIGEPLAFHLTQDPISGRTAPCLSNGNTKNGQCTCGIAYCIQGNCIDRADTAGCNGRGWTEDVSYTLNTIDRPAVCYDADFRNGELNQNATTIQARMSNSVNAGGIICIATQQGGAELRTDGKSPTLTAAAGMSGNNQPVVCYASGFKSNMSAKTYGVGYEENRAPTISAEQHDASVVYAIGNGQADNTGLYEKVGALNCMPDPSAVITKDKNLSRWIVRRLTPLECERLQGFPDGWTDIGDYIDGKGRRKKTTDSARYKALGNSIAIPPWTWVLHRLVLACGADRTMASLFDGIGGFPLIWERINGKGFCLWASEIEEFCIAVTERQFKEV